MRTLLDHLDDMEGRTVEKTEHCDWEDELAIHFTDGSAIIMSLNESYGNVEVEIQSGKPSSSNARAYVDLGIISDAEGREIMENAEVERQRRLTETRRAQYEKLKHEFGD